ncbi:MAG TPA: endonuclease domain-containing protein [Xanthobacteraceae bacterium]|nr:endonuclease domain-containing protein [Xanthobacteraceae bacterium]
MASTVEIARRLRRQQTDAEKSLWLKLRNGRLGGLKFRRQMSLNGFVVDFCCPSAKLIIELDGGQHLEQREQDARRTRDLEDGGYFVLRFWNNDVLQNVDGVLEEILNSANQQMFEPPHPTPSPLGRGSPPERAATAVCLSLAVRSSFSVSRSS